MAGKEIAGTVVEILRESSEQQWKDMSAPERKVRVEIVIHPDDDSIGVAAITVRTDGRWAEGVTLGQRVRLTVSDA